MLSEMQQNCSSSEHENEDIVSKHVLSVISFVSFWFFSKKDEKIDQETNRTILYTLLSQDVTDTTLIVRYHHHLQYSTTEQTRRPSRGQDSKQEENRSAVRVGFGSAGRNQKEWIQ